MLNISKWRIFFVTATCLVAVIFALPNIVQNKYTGSLKKVNLGLDLRGGVHLLLEIDFNSYFAEKLELLRDEVRAKLRAKNIGYMNLSINGEKVSFSLRGDENINVKEIFIDLRNDIIISQEEKNINIIYSSDFIKEAKRKLLQQSIEIVRRRVDETGTREPLIQPQGVSRIILQVPGIQDPERLKAILGKMAKINFHMLNEENPIISENTAYVPAGYRMVPSDENDVKEDKIFYLAHKKSELTGDFLADATATFQGGSPQVSFKFDSIGARKFADITSKNTGKLFAIILDDKVISAPVIREPILGGQGVISGNFTVESANDLALLLRAGSLPAPINIIEERTIGPSLGMDSILAGKTAVMMGMVLIVFLMMWLYSLFGIFANIALIMNIVIIVAALSLFQATLTLPGIAGIVLTIGMAVDANVLIFERIKEESKLDQSIYATIDKGFSSAFKTIIDSNVTTLLAAIILYNFGSGPVKGFAVTLSIGILASMFSAISFTKIMVLFWLKKSKTKKIPI